MIRHSLGILILTIATSAGSLPGATADRTEGRVHSGVLALYDFSAIENGSVQDSAGRSEDSILKIANSDTVRLLPDGLELLAGGRLKSRSRPAKISDMVRIGGEMTLEAWIRPNATDQTGPATILTMSNGTDQRNFLLGQEGDRYVARFRTSRTDMEAKPTLSTLPGSVTDETTHVVFTRDRTGRGRFFVDGELAVEERIPGGTEDWEKASVTLGYEVDVGRPWTGAYHLVAIYGRDLSPREVSRNYRSGHDSRVSASSRRNDGTRLFETEIAPLLARRCLGCHDSIVRHGGLDLSSRKTALAGGASGNAINPGSAETSLVWLRVDAETMPKNLAPLTKEQKTMLRDWIDAGAAWPYEKLDRAVHGGGDRAIGNWVSRLTVSEYIESVRAAVGVDVSAEAREVLPPEVRADGFENTAYNLNVDLRHIEAYSRLAQIVADRLDVREVFDAEEVTEEWVLGLGQVLLRGVLTEHELSQFLGLAESVTDVGGSAEEAARYVVEAMLQSPRFLYRVELQRGDGSAWPIDPYELASRISYMIWGAPPDDELLAKARSGSLGDDKEVSRQVERMLGDPRAVARANQFVGQWLDLDRLANLSPNPERFPGWNASLGADMRAETLEFFRDLVWDQQRPLAHLMNAQFTYLTPSLAKHYGLEPSRTGLARYDLSSVESRGGLLTHGSVLTMGGDDASMVTRGLFILRDVLFSEVGDPPPGLDTTPVPAAPGRPRRDIATERVESSACGGCHARFEPLAFGLEKFDGLGTHSEIDEHGNRLREDGEILFPGESRSVAYSSIAEMMNLLARSDRVQRNITRKFAQFALGRPLVASDQRSIDEIHRSSMAGGGTYQSLVKAVAMSDLTRTIQTEH